MLKVFKNLKDYLDLIIKIVAFIGIMSGVFGVRGCVNHKEDSRNKTNIIESKVQQFKTDSGKIATEVINWKMSFKDLKRKNTELSDLNSQILNERNKAIETIKDFEIRLKDAKNYIKTHIEASDTLKTDFIIIHCDTVKINPIKEKHIKIDFNQTNEGLDVVYNYQTEIYTVVSLFPKRKENGKKHFPNWGWIWGWDEKTTTKVEDENAQIDNLVNISFEK